MSLYYDDVQIGDVLPRLIKGPVTATQLVRYSGASGDFNPIHTVPEIAEEVGLPGLIAHGMLIMAWAGQTLTDWAGPGSVRSLKVRFTDMTRLGETVVCEARVTAMEPGVANGLVKGKLTVKNESGDSQKLKGDFAVTLPMKTD